MNISNLNVKITIQKNTTISDNIGNRINKLTDYYSPYATISGENGKETYSTGNVISNVDICFTIRFCGKVSSLNTTEYRIIFNDKIYNLIFIDNMNYKKKYIKLKCQKVRK